MKKIILLSCLLFLSNLHSQELTCEQKVKKFLIDKIKKYKSDELIPYYSKKENKWGFFDMKSKIKVTKPIFKNAKFFFPKLYMFYDLEINNKENGCKGLVSGSNKKYKIIEIQKSDYQNYDMKEQPLTQIDYSKLIDNSISGFEVENNKIIKFNSKFYNAESNEPINLNPIFFKGKFYTFINEIINSVNYYSIINQKGKKIPGFENLSSYIYQTNLYEDANDIWFQIVKDNKNLKIKSLLENIELEDNFSDFNNYFPSSISYAILKIDNKLGIFDFTTMSWKIKPDSKNDFLDLHYSSLEEIPEQKTIKGILENRKKVKIFIQNSKNEFYDLDMKIYKPKN